MRMSDYAGSDFVKYDDVAGNPRRETIASIKLGGYDRPEATFESGSLLSLNKTNVRTLIKAYGEDSRDWIGCTIELYGGRTEYKGETHDSVLVRPISPTRAAPPKSDNVVTMTNPPAAEPRKRDDMDDEIPF